MATPDMEKSRNLQGRVSANRRDILKAGALGATVGLGGCQSFKRGGNTPAQKNRNQGGDVSKDALKGKTIKIGLLAPYPKDPQFGIGYDAKKAAELAAKEQNQSGGVLGADVQILTRDTNISPATARQKYRELINQNVDFTMGCYLGQVLLQVESLMAQEQKLHLETFSAEEKTAELTKKNYQDYKYRFRFLTNVPQAVQHELQLLKAYSKPCGWETAYMIDEDVAVFDPFAKQFSKQIEKETPLKIEKFKRTSTSVMNWKPMLDEAERLNVDLFLPHLVLTGSTLARQWSVQKRPFQLGGIHIKSMIPSFWKSMNGKVEGLWTMNMATPRSKQTSQTKPFMDRFRKEYGYVSAVYPAYCNYDAVNILCHAIRQTGSLNEADLIPFLEQMPPYKESVLDPQFEFNGPDHPKYPHDMNSRNWNQQGWVVFNQWQERNGKGKQVAFAPPRAAGVPDAKAAVNSGQFVTPPWLPDL